MIPCKSHCCMGLQNTAERAVKEKKRLTATVHQFKAPHEIAPESPDEKNHGVANARLR